MQRVIVDQESRGLLSKLTRIKVLIFRFLNLPISNILLSKYKMNPIVNKLLLARAKFISELHLRRPGSTYSAIGPFSKNKERIRKFNETGDPRYFYQNELDKACFQHDMAYGGFKDLNRRTVADKVLRDKVFNIA